MPRSQLCSQERLWELLEKDATAKIPSKAGSSTRNSFFICRCCLERDKDLRDDTKLFWMEYTEHDLALLVGLCAASLLEESESKLDAANQLTLYVFFGQYHSNEQKRCLAAWLFDLWTEPAAKEESHQALISAADA